MVNRKLFIKFIYNNIFRQKLIRIGTCLLGLVLISSCSSCLKSDKSIEKDLSTSPKDTIELNIRITMISSGGEMPVPKANIYLLDENIINILQNNNVQPVASSNFNQDYAYNIYFSITQLGRYGEEMTKYQEFNKNLNDAIQPHIRYNSKTDLEGKVKLTNVKKGKYYLLAFQSDRLRGVVWNMPIDTSNYKEVILNQGNCVFD